MIESDILKVGCFIVGFLALGVVLNNVVEIVYWKWIDWRYREK